MKAMIFAAGLGRRLRPITERKPKALVAVGGRPLLAVVLERLVEAGVTSVVINLHHLGEQIEAWMERHRPPGVAVRFSREKELLDTGGGLKAAAAFLRGNEPFFVHNVDVLSDIDLRAMYAAHCASGALASLAAKPRETNRPLLFDGAGRLCGRRTPQGDVLVRDPANGTVTPLGFCGIHVVSPRLLDLLSETGAFSIVSSYLRLAGAGEVIRAHRVDGCRWRDAGRPEDLRPL